MAAYHGPMDAGSGLATVPRHADTIVIGAGHAGLTMSWYLGRAGREHVVLERAGRLGGGWLDRWDGFRLVGPNWTASFPDAPYDGDDADGYMPRDEIAGRIASYAARIDAPVVLDTRVDRVRALDGGGFALETSRGPLTARSVTVAIGGFHTPFVPPVSTGLDASVTQLHAHHYHRPADLPPGGVLVVGSGQTGIQLVEELRDAGRETFLSVSTTVRVPRRYRGRDCFGWLAALCDDGDRVGVTLPPVETLPDPRRRLAGNVQLSGHKGGHTVDLRAIGRDGTTLVGRVTGMDGTVVTFGDDLVANLDAADRGFGERFQPIFDRYIDAAGIDAPPAEPMTSAEHRPTDPRRLDLRAAGIGTVLWTTGYRQRLDWIEPSVVDDLGFPRQWRGVSDVPGLSFIGALWQRDQGSATLFGVPRDAQALAASLGLIDPEAGTATTR